MLKSLVAAAALLALAGGPALAIAPLCQGQLQAVGQQLQQKTGAKEALEAKYSEAQKLCAENKDEQAQAMARQIRDELAGKPPEATGSSTAPSPSPTTNR